MSLDDLSRRWREHAPGPTAPAIGERIVAVRARATELERLVRLRDRTETVTALLMLPLFGWLAFRVPHPAAQAGAALIALGCVLVPMRLRAARARPMDPGTPVYAALREERTRLHAQLRLLRSVGWWYLAPLFVGVILFLAGARASLTVRLLLIAVTIVAGIALLALNRRTAQRELAPVIARLDDVLHELERDEEGGARAR
jgi:hypothetical protein